MVIICFLLLFSLSLPPPLVFGLFFVLILFLFRQQNQFIPKHIRGAAAAPTAEQTRPFAAYSPFLEGYLTAVLWVVFCLFVFNLGVIFISFSSSLSFVWGFSAMPGLSCQVQSKGANFSLMFPIPFCCSVDLLFLFSSIQGPSGVTEVSYPQDFYLVLFFFFFLILF